MQRLGALNLPRMQRLSILVALGAMMGSAGLTGASAAEDVGHLGCALTFVFTRDGGFRTVDHCLKVFNTCASSISVTIEDDTTHVKRTTSLTAKGATQIVCTNHSFSIDHYHVFGF